MTTIRTRVLACILGLTSLTASAAHTREVTPQERAAFEAWYQQQPKLANASPPVFAATRENDASPWRVAAYIDGTPRRALRALCRADRATFSFDSSWRAGPAQQLAWQAAGACTVPATRIVLGQRMPDTDILALIEQHRALLTRARLLFAGNTACAPQRAYNYTLTGIDVSVFINGSEEMATLTYQSDRGPVARVWARRTGQAYDPWNVSCP
jgi:hypothetical protein